MSRTVRCLVVVAMIAMFGAGLPMSMAQGGHAGDDGGGGDGADAGDGGGHGPGSASGQAALMARPYPLTRIVGDPWLGGLWLGTDSAGVFYKPLDGDRLYHYGVREGLVDHHVYDVEPTPEDVWLATGKGVMVFDKATLTLSPVERADGSPLAALGRAVHVEGDKVWFGTDEEGLFLVDPDTLKASPVANPVTGEPFSGGIMGIADDGELLYISVVGYGLVEWDRATGEANRYGESLYRPAPQYGRILIQGPDVWLGSSGDGAIRWERDEDRVSEYVGPSTHNAQTVLNMVPYGDRIWFSTEAGIASYDPALDHWKRYDAQSRNFNWTHTIDITLVDGTLYAITRSDGDVISYDPVADRWSAERWFGFRPGDTIFYNEVLDCDRDPATGRMLFSTGGGGANWYDPDTGQWERLIGPDPTLRRQPLDVLIDQTAFDVDPVEQRDDVWFASAAGISRWDRTTDTWHHHRTDDFEVGDPIANTIKDLVVTDDGAWAVSLANKRPTLRGGAHTWYPGLLAHYDKATGDWTHYTKADDGLPSANLSRVAVNGEHVWLGTGDQGLHRFHPGTGTVERVYPPADGPGNGRDIVLELTVHQGTIWAAFAGSGLVRIDASTLAAEPVASLAIPISFLGFHDDVLWAGLPRAGLMAIDPATYAYEWYTSEAPTDAWVHCVVPSADGSLLYVGTQWGVDRFDLGSRTWLPSDARLGPTGVTGSDPPDVAIAVDVPDADATVQGPDPLDVQGTAQGPDGARVQVRVAGSPWVTAEGLATWAASVPLAGQPTGPAVVTARLVLDGEVMAQAARHVRITLPGQAGSAIDDVEVFHVPVIEAIAGEPVRFTVQLRPAPETVHGSIELIAPDGTLSTVTLEATGPGTGSLVGEAVAPSTEGLATYTVTLGWPGAAARLPEPGSPYGDHYRLVVRPVTGTASALLVPPAGPVEATAGVAATVELTLQNTGTRRATFELVPSGEAASWLVDGPGPVELAPGSSTTIVIGLDVPADAAAGTHRLDLTVAPPPGLGTGDVATVEIDVASDVAGPSGERGAPGPGAALVALALVLATVGANRADRPGGRR